MPTNKIVFLISLVSFFILVIGVNRSFTGQHDWNSVVYGNIARNHLRYGLEETLKSSSHYMPLMPLLLALSFFLFGVYEWSARLVPVLSATMMVFFVFKLVEKLWNWQVALFACFFAVFSPMLFYYSKIPVHETVSLGFLGMALWFYVRWLETRSNKNYWLTLFGLVLSMLTTWAGFYLSFYFFLHSVFFEKKWRKGKKWMLLMFLFVPVFLFAVHNVQIYLLLGERAIKSLWSIFLFRLNVVNETGMHIFSFKEFLSLQSQWILVYYTRVMVFLSLVWFVFFCLRRLLGKIISVQESLVVVLFIFGFTYTFLFQNSAYIHDYTLIYALPFFAISAAVALGKIYVWLKRYGVVFGAAVVLVMLVAFATERVSYVKALFHSGDNNPALPVGKYINRHTQFGDGIVVLSPDFMQFHDVFVRFYADRRVIEAKSVYDIDLEAIDYIAIPKSHDYVALGDKLYLYKNFSLLEADSVLLFKVKDDEKS